MSPSPQLAPPGSSSYSSNTLHVGDGTWDASRDDFLLPNLVGLNFATMRYNGMGNRFFTMAGYQSTVKAHGIIAAITFLGVVPAAIFFMRFYGRRPRQAVRFHIWLQILTLLLSTVAVILGFFAVGPSRKLTNPHHGIGVAIYVLIWFQFLGGALVHRSEKRNRPLHLTLKAMLHHWLGRSIALLGIVQVALGLTLYGSPQYLFVLYTLFVFALVLLYFILEWVHERRMGDHDGQGSYYSDQVIEPRKDRWGVGKIAAVGAAGLGLAALLGRRSSKRNSRPDVVGTDSRTSYEYDEKYSETSHHGWGKRILEIGAVGAGLAAVKALFDRRKHRDDESDISHVHPPLGGNQNIHQDSMSRIEEGRPPTGNSPGFIRPTHPLANPPLTPGRRNSNSSYTYSYYSDTPGSPSRRDRRTHTFRDALAAGGVALAARQLFKNRRQKKEDRRAEELRVQRVEEERIARMNSAHKYTGDGITPPRKARMSRLQSQSGTDISGHVVNDHYSGPGMSGALPAAGIAAAAAGALAGRERIRPVGTDPPIITPGPPMAMPYNNPPIPPVHRVNADSSGSDMYISESGQQRHRHHLRDEAAAGLAGAAIGAVATDAARRRRSGRNTDSLESPPVSLKVKMHNDGRHVTLRRLTEEEAAAQREGRRLDEAAPSSRRRRNSSFSSGSGAEGLGGRTSGDRRWRRTEAIEAEQAQAAGPPYLAAPQVVPATAYPPPPPPGTSHPPFAPQGTPQSTSVVGGPQGSVTSPGTEGSAATDYANNRRRRRAQRAQARLAREGGAGGNSVDFT